MEYLDLALQYAVPFAKGLLVLIIGWMIVGAVVGVIGKVLDKRNIDATLRPIIKSTVSILLKIALLLAVASTMGMEVTSFVAILGAIGFAAGLAWQGSLANLAGGVLLLIFRPFKVGDYIKGSGTEGFVKEIQPLVTVLETPDKSTIYLPNGALANGNIENVSQFGQVRLHLECGIGYGEDIQAARDVLMEVMDNHPLVLKNPVPQVAVTNLGGSSVDLTLRPWCEPANAPAVTVEILEQAKVALDKANIEIPFPQQVVTHVNNN